jgi:hypothetical protein
MKFVTAFLQGSMGSKQHGANVQSSTGSLLNSASLS